MRRYRRTTGIHVVGLNLDVANVELQNGIEKQRQARSDRGARIAARLEQAGYKDTLEGARQIAGDAILGRPHFAQFLVEEGQLTKIAPRLLH